MAQRRMISLEVIDTDAFLDMPSTSQLLYFHLNARADDDGFVAGPKKIMRALGSSADDLLFLVGKKFVISFGDGVCVIKHWRVNNFVRKDIYKETQYLDLRRTLFIRPNGAYTLTDDGSSVPLPKGYFSLENIEDIHVNVTSTSRQLREGKVREGKVRLVKEKETPETSSGNSHSSKEENKEKFTTLGADLIKAFITINPACAKFYSRPPQRRACDELIRDYGFDKVLNAIEKVIPETNGLQYFPTITTPIQLQDKWVQLQSAIRKYQSENKKLKSSIAF